MPLLRLAAQSFKMILDNLVTSLVFLDQVGLKPVILHGAGPMLSAELDNLGIDFSFIDGQRVTSPQVRDVAQRIFKQTNNQIVEALELLGANACRANIRYI